VILPDEEMAPSGAVYLGDMLSLARSVDLARSGDTSTSFGLGGRYVPDVRQSEQSPKLIHAIPGKILRERPASFGPGVPRLARRHTLGEDGAAFWRPCRQVPPIGSDQGNGFRLRL
jgi:hypothetical protein